MKLYIFYLSVFMSLRCLKSEEEMSEIETYDIWFSDTKVVAEINKTSQLFHFRNGPCSIELNLNKSVLNMYAEQMKNKSLLKGKDIFFITLGDQNWKNMSTTEYEHDGAQHGFAAVKFAKESKYKYLPYSLNDLNSLVSMTPGRSFLNKKRLPPSIFEVTLDQPLSPACLTENYENSGIKHLIANLNENGKKVFIALLLYVITHNPELSIDSRFQFEICTSSVILRSDDEDAPFTLTKCCDEQAKTIFELSVKKNSQYVTCHNPDYSRRILSDLTLIGGVILMLLSPLGLIFMPSIHGNTALCEYEDEKNMTPSIDAKNDDSVISNSQGDKEQMIALNMAKEEEASHTISMTDESVGTNKNGDKTGTAPSKLHGRVYFNTNPEFRLNPSLIVAYLLLFKLDNYVVTILRRLLFLASSLSLTGFLMFVTYNFYRSLWFNAILRPQSDFIKSMFILTHHDKYVAQEKKDDTTFIGIIFMSMVIYIPLFYTAIQAILLFFIFVKPREDVCQILYWEHKDCFWGRKMPFSDEIPKPDPSLSHRELLIKNILFRLTVAMKIKFWKFWWNDCVCQNSKTSGGTIHDQKRKLDAKEVCVRLIRVPFFYILMVLYTVPVISVLTNIFMRPRSILLPECCKRHGQGSRWIFLTFPMTILGIALIYLFILDLSILCSQAIVFVSIDLLRDTDTGLPRIIFVISIIVYIRQAFVVFEDDYRKLKVCIFSICRGIDGEALGRGKVVISKMNPDEILFVDRPIPSVSGSVYIATCKRFLPYKQTVVNTLVRLFLKIALIAFLFLVAIEFQIFENFTASGQTLLTLFTVSIPHMLGMLGSDGFIELLAAEKQNKMECAIQNMVTEKDDVNHNHEMDD